MFLQKSYTNLLIEILRVSVKSATKKDFVVDAGRLQMVLTATFYHQIPHVGINEVLLSQEKHTKL